jgi:hypothetical protein
MSGCIASRLDSSIAAAKDLIHQLGESSNQVPLDTLFVNVFSTYSYDGGPRAGTLLCTIALLKRPVTPTLLAALLEIPLKEVTALLQTFVDERLVTPESPAGPVTEAQTFRLCDQSLLEFSVDPFRSRARHDMIDPAESHRNILDRCLRLLNTHLREDICNIRNPGLANTDVRDLPARIAQYVPEAVRYACVSWPMHLVGSSSVSATVSAALLDFCTEHILNWLEVLSLLGEQSSVGNYLPKITSWCQVNLLYVTWCGLMRTNRIISWTCL